MKAQWWQFWKRGDGPCVEAASDSPAPPTTRVEVAQHSSGSDGARSQPQTLHGAASSGDIEAVQRLLEVGVDVDSKTELRQTALNFAAQGGHAEIARCLLAAGADVGARDFVGWQPLHWAAYCGHPEVAGVLLDNGAEINDQRNDHGTTPLDRAVSGRSHSVAQLLVERGASIGAEDGNRDTALFNAAVKGDADMVGLLLRAGANPNTRGEGGMTPLDVTHDAGIVQQLVQAGAGGTAAPDTKAQGDVSSLSENAHAPSAGDGVEETTCLACGGRTPLPQKDVPFGSALICANCRVPLIRHDAGAPVPTSPALLETVYGMTGRGLEHVGCPFCHALNYAVVFPAKGMALAWFAVGEPENPEGYSFKVECVACAKEFYVEWDENPY